MTPRLPKSALFDAHSQYVIYGANGWMGRTAIDFLASLEAQVSMSQILLIGSKPGNLVINDVLYEILEPSKGFHSIQENAIFLNSAFLRREAIMTLSSSEYNRRNQEISDFAKKVLKQKNLYSFINLSSGAARNLDDGMFASEADEYSILKKKLEIDYFEIGVATGTPIVNCRIFSLSGKYLNEFNNLALSSFIKQANSGNQIEVRSPETNRTYVDAFNLIEVLFNLAIKGEGKNLDSGGTLITMVELANHVAMALGKADYEIIRSGDKSPDYFGNFEYFNKIAADLNIDLLGIQDQIVQTLQAFK